MCGFRYMLFSMGDISASLVVWEERIHLPLLQTQEMQAWSPSQKDALEKEMAPYSRILAWRILWTEGPGRVESMGSQRVRHDWVNEYTQTHRHTLTHSLKHTHSHTLTHTHTLTHSHTHTHTPSHALTHSLSHSHSHTLTHSLSLSHTHTITLTHTHCESQSSLSTLCSPLGPVRKGLIVVFCFCLSLPTKETCVHGYFVLYL